MAKSKGAPEQGGATGGAADKAPAGVYIGQSVRARSQSSPTRSDGPDGTRSG